MSADALRYKINKKLKIGASRSNNFNDGNKKVQSALGEREFGGKRNLKLGVKDKNIHAGQEGNLGMVYAKKKPRPWGSDGTRKRIYADQEIGREVVSYGNAKAPNRKALSRKGQNQVKDDLAKAKDRNISSRSMWISGNLEDDTFKSKSSSCKVKNTVKSAQVSDAGLSKKHSRINFGSSKGLDPSEKKSPAVSLLNSAKKKVRGRRNPEEDLEISDEQPKKRKRVIRIDPYDISNKRLNDEIIDGGEFFLPQFYCICLTFYFSRFFIIKGIKSLNHIKLLWKNSLI